MTTALGYTPQDISVVLSVGQDFILSIEIENPEDVPDDTQVELKFYTPGTQKLPPDEWPDPLDTWPATVSSGVVNFNTPFSKADEIPKKAWARLHIQYPNGINYIWAHGAVVRDD